MKKRISIFLLTALLILGLCACAEKKTQSALEPYTTGWDGAVYTITPIDAYKGTISDGTNTYSYRYDTSGTGYSVTFTYPDGETYTWKEDGNFSSGSTSLNFDSDKYPDGMTLNHILECAPSAKSEIKSTKSWGVILLLLLIGGINTACPQLTWHLDVGWKVKDAEPSEAALAWNRGTGIVMLVIAGIMILV